MATWLATWLPSARCFARQGNADVAVVGIDDADGRAVADGLERVTRVSGAVPADVWCDCGLLRDRTGVIADLGCAQALPGVHNAQNAAAAAALAMALGVSRADIARGIETFAGLAHRQELVATIDGIRFINDSKATNAEASARALMCYERVIWIAGGIAKAGGIALLAGMFGRVAEAFSDRTGCGGVQHHVASPWCGLPDCGDAGASGARGAGCGEDTWRGHCSSLAGWCEFRPVCRLRGTWRALCQSGQRAWKARLMATFSRADQSVLGRWWWTVDRWTLFCIAALIGFGYVLVLAASPAVAERIHQSRDVFIAKQVVFLALAGLVIVGVSLLSPRNVRRVALVGCVAAILLTGLTLVHGIEIKGARRWIALPGMSIQPSEFLKPCFAVVTAWLLTEGRRTRGFPGTILAFGMFGVILMLLKSQPDIGMLTVITAVFFAQLFVSGMNMAFVGVGALGMAGAAVGAFVMFPHVRSRVMRFIHPESGDHYQVDTALQAFGNGGLLGRGPGEGRVKDLLPDAHADFVFAVAGEEFGLLICLTILGVFAFIVLRGLLRLVQENDEFVILAATGLVTGFGLQAFVNMASALHLIPTKGMTLPFISYGGSSALSVALGMGMLLALTRRRTHGDPL